MRDPAVSRSSPGSAGPASRDSTTTRTWASASRSSMAAAAATTTTSAPSTSVADSASDPVRLEWGSSDDSLSDK